MAHYGYSREEFLNMRLTDIRPAEDVPETIRVIRTLRTQPGWSGQTRHRLKDGRVIDVEVTASALDWSGRRVVLSVVQDISERKQAEKARELLALIVESTDEAVLGIGPDQTILSWNRAAERLYGYTAAEIRGKPLTMLIPPEHFERLDYVQKKLARGESVSHFEGLALTKDGRRVDISLTVSPLVGAAGQFMGSAAIVRDISERKRAEEDLKRAKAAAEAASAAKSEFLAIMSHEIRAPMNGILGMTELALETELTFEQREYLEMVKDSADDLLALTIDLLDLSRIEAGKLSLDSTRFDLHDIIGSALKALALRAHQKGLELICQIPPDLPSGLVGDPGRLRQVVVNLVGNAIKFTERGEVRLAVEVESQTEDEVSLHFTVTDTGIGIAEEQHERIFEPFAQADSSTTRKHGGVGLGLAIAARLVAMLRGRIWVESEVGKGSTFHFAARLGLQSPAARPVPSEAAALRDLAVLVVDDNASTRHTLEAMLKHWAMKPTLVDSNSAGVAALEQARESGKPFPVVLLDAQMPGRDGFIVAERLKQDPTLAGATIMMLTSDALRRDSARWRALNVAASLCKPIRDCELLETMLHALRIPVKEHRRSPDKLHEFRETPRKLRILVVEDSAINQRLLVRLLEKRGHSVEEAANGREALAKLERTGFREFDLVLMDVQMPEMDGFEATAVIRQREKASGAHLPIVALTARVLKGDLERCLGAGMDAYVSKPLRTQELFSAIAGVLGLPSGEEREEEEKEPERTLLDVQQLWARVEGDKQLLVQLIGLFLNDYPKLLATMREAILSQDAQSLERAAHTLRSSLGILAAPYALEGARSVETLGRNREFGGAAEATRRLELEIERLQPVLMNLAKENAA